MSLLRSPERSLGPLPMAIAVAVGIALAPWLDRTGVPASASWIFALALGVLAARHRLPALALVAVAAAGAAHGARAPAAVPPGATVDDRGIDRIAGEIAGPVVRTRRGYAALLVPAAGDAVWLRSDAPLAPGEQVIAIGALRTPRGGLGPGEPDRADAAAARGARFELVAREIERVADAPGLVARTWRWAARVQATWSARVEAAGGEPAARAAVRGIVVGDRTAIPEALDARWRATGIFHVLSVSGLHLAVIAGLAFALLRRLLAASPLGGRIRPARWAAPPALAIAIAYTLVTGAQLATLRALVVIALVLVAAVLDRPLRLRDALGVAALAVLAWRPADLFDPSFQLSFTAALTLAVVAARPPGPHLGVARWLVRGVTASAWVTLTTAPITAFHFHQVTPGGVLGNLVLTPAVELVALPLALAGIALDWHLPIAVATWLVARVDDLAALLAHAMPVGRVALAGGATLAVIVATSLALAAGPARRGVRALAWALLCMTWLAARTPPAPGELRVTFLDVGQGDAALVELPDGAVWLIDAGGHASARDPAAAQAPGRTIARALAVYGHARIDLAIVSHAHPDHYLGLGALDVPITELWSVAEPEPRATTDDAYARLVRALARGGTHVATPPLGVARAQAGVELVVWAPRYQAAAGAPLVQAADPVRTVNDNSLVVELRYRGRALLFAGDLELEGEEALVAAGLARVDVVKVAHHGSPTSSTPAFVAAARPALAVISCGRANAFGFPAPAVVERWRAVGADVARTDRDGAITVRVDAAGGLHVAKFAGPAS